jgi:hypothetical protein
LLAALVSGFVPRELVVGVTDHEQALVASRHLASTRSAAEGTLTCSRCILYSIDNLL